MTHLPLLNFRRRIGLLVWSRRSLWLLGAIVVISLHRRSGVMTALLCTMVALSAALKAWEGSLRRQFVRAASLPEFLVRKLRSTYPQLAPRDVDLVLRGLRQFFMAHLRSQRKFVAMPSKLVDAAWHEFILHTQGYQRWCEVAFGGLLHHSPAEVLGHDARRNDGLRRSWYWACKEENIDPRTPNRLPLLFALDAKFGVPGGFRYVPDCRDIDRQGGSGAHCGTSFGESSGGAGDADGFGASDSAGDGDSSDGGCGGGGD